MKKNIQRAALAAVVGAFAIMTGCDQADYSMERKDKTQDRRMKGRMDEDRSSKPMPERRDDRYNGGREQNGNGNSYNGGCN